MKNNFSGKKLLVVGAGIFQVPAIRKAKDMGITVITVDKNPQSQGFKYADYYEVVSTHATAGILKTAQKHRVDGIMTLSTEVGVVPAAYVAEKLNLPGLPVKVARTATNKYLMKQAFKEHNVPCPEFCLAGSAEELKKIKGRLDFPLMVKPTSGYASKSVFKVNNPAELEKAFYAAKEVSYDGKVIAEEFIDGQEVGGETFTLDGLTEIVYITNKRLTEPPLYIPLGHSLPCRFPEEIQDEIMEVAVRGIKALGVKNGPVNFDIMVTEKGPVVLEMGARLGGNCLPVIVEFHSGIDTISGSIKLALGGKPSLKEKFRRPIGVKLFTSMVTGRIVNISGVEELSGNSDVLEINLIQNIGDTVSEFSSGMDKAGYIIVTGEDIDGVERKLDHYVEKIKITVS